MSVDNILSAAGYY